MITLANRSDAVKHLERLWAGQPEAVYVARIVNFIAENSGAKYLPMKLFLELGERKNDGVIAGLISYLAGAELHLLNVNLEFIEDEYVRFLEPDEANAATKDKINPQTGEVDQEIESKLFIYFSPTETALKILAR